MNNPLNTTPAARAAMENAGLPNATAAVEGMLKPIMAEPAVTCLTASQIVKLSMTESRDLYDAFRLAEMAMGGIINQPRFNNENTKCLNAPGEIIESLHGYLNECIELLIRVSLSGEVPTDKWEAESRAWLRLKYEADCMESLPTIATIAAEEVSNVSADRKAVRA